MALRDWWNRLVRPADLGAPQTAREVAMTASLASEWEGHPARGLTPAGLVALLEAAETGDLLGQLDLAEDMLERDPHLYAELAKRARAVAGLDWTIAPAPGASRREERAAAQAGDWLRAQPDLPDWLLMLGDALLKGYACLEIEWAREEGLWLPRGLAERPQRWLQTHPDRRDELRLRDGSRAGLELAPFGWVLHRHRAKSGYVGRAGLVRVLAWPYLLRQYAQRYWTEWLEVYGLPARLGTYPPGASAEEKRKLLAAVRDLGHDAAGIIPEGQRIEYLEAVAGDGASFERLLQWAERSISKAVLGATLTSEVGDSGSRALGDVHQDVMWDLVESDARQIAGTLSRDLVWPLVALNLGVADPRRAPRLVFDLGEAEDLKEYAEALPALTAIGLRIPERWARERLRIPEPQGDEPLLGRAAPAAEPAPGAEGGDQEETDPPPGAPPGRAAARTELGAPAEGATPDPQELLAERLEAAAAPALAAWLQTIRAMLEGAESLEEFRARLDAAYPQLAREGLTAAMAEALAAATLAGMSDVADEAG
jgi:phage gp29-like protein